MLHFTELQEFFGVLDFVMALLFAGCLERLEHGEVFLQAAVDTLLVERQEFEVFRFGGEDSRGGVCGLDLRVFFGEFIGVLGEAEGEEVVFDGARSVETPAVGRDTLGELDFEGPFGAMDAIMAAENWS
jgi:hypothetical protein